MIECKTLSQTLMEMDEIEMSKHYPDTLFVTLIQNGMTVTLPVQKLFELFKEEIKHAAAD